MTASGPLLPKPSSRTFATVQISTEADGLSDTINLTGLTLSAIQMSTDWTDAQIGFKSSIDNSTDYLDIYDSDGILLTYETSANRVVAFDPAVFAGIQRLQLVSETSAGVVVVQATERTIKLGLSEYVVAN